MLPPSLRVFPLGGWPGLVPDCARRTTTVSPWGFREQGGPTRPPSFLIVGERLISLRPSPGFPLKAVILSAIPRPGIEHIHHALKLAGQFRHRPQQDSFQGRDRLLMAIGRALLHHLQARPIMHHPLDAESGVELRTKTGG